MDVEKGAVIDLRGGMHGTASPTITTAPMKVGLFYQFREGETLGGMKDGDSTVGDGKPWSPEIKVKGGASAFYPRFGSWTGSLLNTEAQRHREKRFIYLVCSLMTFLFTNSSFTKWVKIETAQIIVLSVQISVFRYRYAGKNSTDEFRFTPLGLEQSKNNKPARHF